jgi:hypothetical protein
MTRDEIFKLAREAGFTDRDCAVFGDLIAHFGFLVAAAEREACAKVCYELVLNHPGRADLTADQCAADIRARGQE